MPYKDPDKRRAFAAAYSKANREKVYASGAAWRERNREKLREEARTYNAANRDKKRAYYEANADKIRAKNRAYGEANSEKRRAYGAIWREENKEKRRAYGRKHYLKKKYGLDENGVRELLRKQNYACALCEDKLTEETACVDHCHDSGVVRGILCNMCNIGIGLLKEDPETIRRALKYVEGAQLFK